MFYKIDPWRPEDEVVFEKIQGQGPRDLRTAELQRSSSQKQRRPRRFDSDMHTETKMTIWMNIFILTFVQEI